MKKLLLSLALSVACFAGYSQTIGYPYAAQATLHAAGYTNLFLGSARIGQIVVTAPTATNALVSIVDTYNGALTNFIAAYTNTLSYGTNALITVYTNYYGVTTLLTNGVILVDSTNNVVPAITNLYQQYTLAAVASASSVTPAANLPINRGIWVTNNGTGDAVITLSFVPR